MNETVKELIADAQRDMEQGHVHLEFGNFSGAAACFSLASSRLSTAILMVLGVT